MFHVTYEADHLNNMVSQPKVGCNICRCAEGERVRCFHHPSGRHALQTYLYFKKVWSESKELDCLEAVIQ